MEMDHGLHEQWTSWLNEVNELLQPNLEKLNSPPEAAAVHLVVLADGQIAQCEPYQDGGASWWQDKKLIERLRSEQLPRFPNGSGAQFTHIIVNVH
jgi:hypothetical protein